MSTDKTIGATPVVVGPKPKAPVLPPLAPAPTPGVAGDRLRVAPGAAPARDPLATSPRRSSGDMLADPHFDEAAVPPTPAPAAPPAPSRKERVRQVTKAIETQAAQMAQAVGEVRQASTAGNVVARGFNSFIDVFSHNQRDMEAAADHAIRLFKSELPADLARYNAMVDAAGEDPAKLAAADAFLQGALDRAKRAGEAFDKTTKDFKQGSKFWAGLTADVSAGLMVLGGTALCITGFGAPIGAGLIAGAFVAGGATTVGMHALIDNQYEFKKEALGNFLVGGISAGATVLTAGASQGATQTISRLAVRQGAIGGASGLAGAAANEASNGWQDGWALRMFTSAAVSTVTGAAVGAGSGAAVARFVPQGLSPLASKAVSVGVSTASGAVGAGAGSLVNEGIGGFEEGWLDRVMQQVLGGGISGLAYGFGPDLAARNQALLAKNAAFAASPRGQAVAQLHENLSSFNDLMLPDGIVVAGVKGVSAKTQKALATALRSEHGSIDAVGAANVDHLGSVFSGVLQRAYKQNGGKPLTQAQVDRLAMETVLTDAWAKGNSAKDLETFRTAPTNAGQTAGEIFAHLKAEAKKAINAPKGSEVERVIDARIEAGKLNPGLGFDPEFQAAVKASGLSEGQTKALLTRVNKNFLNVTPAMLGTWVHGVPSFDHVAQIVQKAGGSRVEAQQVYEAVLGHHMSGFIANGFARGKLTLDFPAMVKAGQLTPEAATRLGHLYGSATALAEKWRPIVDKITQKGQTVVGPDGQKTTIFTLTPKQRAAYERAAEPYRQAVAELPEHVRSQLVNDDQRQFTQQGMPKWLRMMEVMKQPKSNAALLDTVYREPLQAYLLENVARGSHEPFIEYSMPAARKLGMVFDPESMSFQRSKDPQVVGDLARRIQADAVLKGTLEREIQAGALTAKPTAQQVVDWFMTRTPSSEFIVRVMDAP